MAQFSFYFTHNSASLMQSMHPYIVFFKEFRPLRREDVKNAKKCHSNYSSNEEKKDNLTLVYKKIAGRFHRK
jgi:hypothetical protein